MTSSSSSDSHCSICTDPLLIPNESDEPGPSHLPDDVRLICGHHFHWECLFDYAQANPQQRTCSVCGASILSPDGLFLVDVTNEGGFTGGYDLGAELAEEALLEAHPAARRKELFFALLRQGDHAEVEEFLKGEDESEPGAGGLNPNVRAEEGGLTGLHVAAFANDVHGTRLLLHYGADASLRALDGTTPLECALMAGSSDVAELLSS